MTDANVDYCKVFWQLIETDIFRVLFELNLIETIEIKIDLFKMSSNFTNPFITVNLIKKISFSSSLTLPTRVNFKENDSTNSFVSIDPPQNSESHETIQIRVLSSEIRDGMVIN